MTIYDDVLEELRKELPELYDGIKDFQELLKAESKQLADLEKWSEEALDQFFVETASWALSRWEKIYGVYTDVNKPLDQRRSVILAKMRGAGVTTVALVKEVADSWYNGSTEIIESSGVVSVKFNSNLGVPSNLADVAKALREIMPAHLMIKFEFKYVTYGQMRYAPYKAWAALTYDELLTTFIDFSGTVNSALQNYSHTNLSEYTYAQLEGGQIT